MAGMPYLVGEHRPEVVVPQQTSMVYPSVASYLSQRTSPPASSQQITTNAVYNQQQTTSINLTAQYKFQDMRTLAQEVRTLQMLYPST